MPKLEEKLIELGYVLKDYDNRFNEYNYVKTMFSIAELHIYYCKSTKTHYGLCIYRPQIISQQVINNLQQAYNQLQQDLEELKEYE